MRDKRRWEKNPDGFESPVQGPGQKNNYPEVLAESMVTKSMEVYQLTMDGETVYMDQVQFNDLTEEEKSRITQKKLWWRKVNC